MNELVWTIAVGVAMGIALYRFIYSTSVLIQNLVFNIKTDTPNQGKQDNLK